METCQLTFSHVLWSWLGGASQNRCTKLKAVTATQYVPKVKKWTILSGLNPWVTWTEHNQSKVFYSLKARLKIQRSTNNWANSCSIGLVKHHKWENPLFDEVSSHFIKSVPAQPYGKTKWNIFSLNQCWLMFKSLKAVIPDLQFIFSQINVKSTKLKLRVSTLWLIAFCAKLFYFSYLTGSSSETHIN